MSPVAARAELVGRALALVALAGVLAGCSSQAGHTHSAMVPPAVTAPLDTTLSTPSGEVAVVAMGILEDPLNTFWQLFFRPGPESPWTLVTPPGVADNGGLVVSADSLLLAGFEPSQDLTFSPLAASVDQGGSWTPGLVPGGLATVPDALAVSSGTGLVALVRDGGGEVLRSGGALSTWSELAGRDDLASSADGRTCGVGELTAVAVDASHGALVGTTCTSPGVVGIFDAIGGVWQLVGPRLATPSAPTKVLRLTDVNGACDALVASAGGSAIGLIGVTGAPGGPWSSSPPLSLVPGADIVSTAVASDGGFVVLASARNRPLALDVENGPGGPWRALPTPPLRTTTVVVSGDGEVDALVAAATVLTDWRLDAPTATWSKIGTVSVPIAFGSSS
ncbi:MAG TPA: hypothetical protein VED63_06855 [Acidimicrobiales bacterium]|nr:hypothetical protein [Acidimicrobiales bacterium]